MTKPKQKPPVNFTGPTLCLLANLAYQMGPKLPRDDAQMKARLGRGVKAAIGDAVRHGFVVACGGDHRLVDEPDMNARLLYAYHLTDKGVAVLRHWEKLGLLDDSGEDQYGPADAPISFRALDLAAKRFLAGRVDSPAPPKKFTTAETGRFTAARNPVEEVPRTARNSILQPWVEALGLRHQGVLLTCVRGCDTAPKDDASKLLTRCFRATILRPHCGDAAKAATFIQQVDLDTLVNRMNAFRKNLDHYPHHYVMHFVHGAEIVGYKHPAENVGGPWRRFYFSLCRGLHVIPEPMSQLDERLDADEATFAARD